MNNPHTTNNSPIFIFGLPRSGTTWVGKVFDSHPDTLYRHEPDSLAAGAAPITEVSSGNIPPKGKRIQHNLILCRQWANIPHPIQEDVKDEYAKFVEEYVAALPTFVNLKVVGKLPLFSKSYLSMPRYLRFKFGVYAAKLSAKLFSNYDRNWPVFGAPRTGPKGSTLVWKSIESLGRLSLLLNTMPDSRAIHIIRHPCGYVASQMRGHIDQKLGLAASDDYGILKRLLETDLAKSFGLTIDDLKQCLPEERLAWRWLLANENTLVQLRGNNRYLPIMYDDICENPLNEFKRMFAFAGLGWCAQSERFVRSSISSSKKGYYSIYKIPTTSANRWRQELSDNMINRIVAIATRGPSAERFRSFM